MQGGKMRKLTIILYFVIFFLSFTAFVYAPQSQAASVEQGRALLFNNGESTYSGLIAANNEFKAVVLANPSNQEANFFYAVTRILVFALEQPNTPGYAALSTLGDLFGAFGALRNNVDYMSVDAPFDDPPEIYDDYDPPETIPSGETIRQFWAVPCITLINNAIANLEIITADPFDVTLYAWETGDMDVQVDRGDILFLKSALYTFKAFLLIGTSYNWNISASDMQRFISLENGDLLRFQQDILDVYTNFLQKNGTDSLTEARTALLQGISLYRDAFNYITTETDYQGDDFLYFDTTRDQHSADHILTVFEELETSLNANAVGTFTTNEQFWQLATSGLGNINFSVDLDSEDKIAGEDLHGGRVDDFFISGSTITIVLVDRAYPCPGSSSFKTTFTGTLSGNAIAGGTYTGTNCFGTFHGTFTGLRTCNKTETEKMDFNYLFGNSGKAKLDIRGVLPEFDPYDEPVPGTFPPIDDSTDVFNGIFPDYATNIDMAREMDLQPSGNFTIPYGMVNMDGFPESFPTGSTVFTDVSGDGDPARAGQI